MAHDSARDLLRASVTDGDAVRGYLESIESHEVHNCSSSVSRSPLIATHLSLCYVQLNELLDGLSSCTHKEKQQQQENRHLPQSKCSVLVHDDWLPLIRLLVQCETTRLRTASRVLYALRRGRPSELESMQLLTEVSLGYSSALDELQEVQKKNGTTRRMVQRQKLRDEVHAVLDTVFCFLEEEVVVSAEGGMVVGRGDKSGGRVCDSNGSNRSGDKVKLLPQLLGLVSFFLGLCGELRRKGEQETSEVRRSLRGDGSDGNQTVAKEAEGS